MRQIAQNAGYRRSRRRRQAAGSQGHQIRASTPRWRCYADLVKAGIIDPTKVVRAALQDAASVAGLLITTEAMIADKPEPAGAGAPAMPDMGGMGGMGGMM